jgi:crotonobetainyl-CoA:carnitine CoA-transferase CaiB-like acyl-CoA transferase
LEVLGLTGAVTRPRAAWGASEAASLAAAIKKRTVAQLIAALEEAGVWAESCKPNAEHDTLNDAGLVAAGTIYLSQHPQFGAMRQLGPLFRFSGSPNEAAGHTPLVGEFTDAIMQELGYSAAQIASLRERKVIA